MEDNFSFADFREKFGALVKYTAGKRTLGFYIHLLFIAGAVVTIVANGAWQVLWALFCYVVTMTLSSAKLLSWKWTEKMLRDDAEAGRTSRAVWWDYLALLVDWSINLVNFSIVTFAVFALADGCALSQTSTWLCVAAMYTFPWVFTRKEPGYNWGNLLFWEQWAVVAILCASTAMPLGPAHGVAIQAAVACAAFPLVCRCKRSSIVEKIERYYRYRAAGYRAPAPDCITMSQDAFKAAWAGVRCEWIPLSVGLVSLLAGIAWTLVLGHPMYLFVVPVALLLGFSIHTVVALPNLTPKEDDLKAAEEVERRGLDIDLVGAYVGKRVLVVFFSMFVASYAIIWLGGRDAALLAALSLLVFGSYHTFIFTNVSKFGSGVDWLFLPVYAVAFASVCALRIAGLRGWVCLLPIPPLACVVSAFRWFFPRSGLRGEERKAAIADMPRRLKADIRTDTEKVRDERAEKRRRRNERRLANFRRSRGGTAGLCLAVAFAASAAFGAVPWDEMWQRPVAPQEGVTVRAYALDKPRLMKAYVARIDLGMHGIGFTATERSAHWGEAMPDYTNRTVLIDTKRERTADFMMRRRSEGLPVAVAVNASPWGPWDCSAAYRSKYGAFAWWNVSDGVELSRRKNPRRGAFFLVYKDGRVDVASSVPPSRTNEVAFALCGFGLLMTNGVPFAPYVRRTAGRLNPRTAFGLTADRRTLVLLVVDGRQPNYSLGADSDDLCGIFRAEGVTDAVDMDGGGSSSLVVYDSEKGCPRMLNHHARNVQRANALNFGITFPGVVARTGGIGFDTLISHRGESVDVPENTLPAYRTAVSRGFGFECDIYLSKDGRVFTFHDRTLTRTSGGANTNKCNDATWSEVAKLDVGSWGKWKGSRFAGTRPALLEEVLELTRDGRWLYIDVKSKTADIVPYVKAIFDKQSRANPGNTLFLCGSLECGKEFKRLMPGYKVLSCLNCCKGWKPGAHPVPVAEIIATTKEMGADGVDLRFIRDVTTKEYMKAIRDAGLELHVWTVDDLDDALEAFRRGAKTVTTNCAKKLMEESRK